MTFEEAKKMVDSMTEEEKENTIECMDLTSKEDLKIKIHISLLVLELDAETKEPTDNILYVTFPEGTYFETDDLKVGRRISIICNDEAPAAEHFYQILEISKCDASDPWGGIQKFNQNSEIRAETSKILDGLLVLSSDISRKWGSMFSFDAVCEALDKARVELETHRDKRKDQIEPLETDALSKIIHSVLLARQMVKQIYFACEKRTKGMCKAVLRDLQRAEIKIDKVVDLMVANGASLDPLDHFTIQ